jgi:peptide/nickel transport system ATP-binding protein
MTDAPVEKRAAEAPANRDTPAGRRPADPENSAGSAGTSPFRGERGGDALAGGPILTVTGLTRVFGRGPGAVHAVDDVSFALNRGQVTTIVGESGSGKSTLARMILRLLPITSGSIELAGRDVTHLRGRALRDYWRDVQAVFQDPFSAFNQFFTVRRLMTRVQRLMDPADGPFRERVVAALDQVGLPKDVLDKHPHQLSGGQRQRVMIARALLLKPVLLIADEATSMLDASLRANTLNVLTDLSSQANLTILFITHDIGQACYVSDRVLVMKSGKLVESGPAEEVIFRPRHEYTQRLLADVPRLHDVGR